MFSSSGVKAWRCYGDNLVPLSVETATKAGTGLVTTVLFESPTNSIVEDTSSKQLARLSFSIVARRLARDCDEFETRTPRERHSMRSSREYDGIFVSREERVETF
jgi:hypothetical protein